MSEESGDRCTSCDGNGNKYVQRGDELLMEQCECSVKNDDGLKFLGSHFKGLWLNVSGSGPQGEPWSVRVLQEVDGVVTLRSLDAPQLKVACNAGPNRPQIWSVVIALISELAKTQRELEAAKQRLDEIQRKIEPLERAAEWVWQVRTAPQRIVKDRLRELWKATVRVGTPHF